MRKPEKERKENIDTLTALLCRGKHNVLEPFSLVRLHSTLLDKCIFTCKKFKETILLSLFALASDRGHENQTFRNKESFNLSFYGIVQLYREHSLPM
jgi:hypothetical protein